MNKDTLIEYGRTIIVVIVLLAIVVFVFGPVFLPKMDEMLNANDAQLLDIPAKTVPVVSASKKTNTVNFEEDTLYIDIPVYDSGNVITENDYYSISAYYEDQDEYINITNSVKISFSKALLKEENGIEYIHITRDYIGKTITIDFDVALDSVISDALYTSANDRISFDVVSE